MLSELDLLLEVARRLEEAGLDYMLTGSMALNHYAQPRSESKSRVVPSGSLARKTLSSRSLTGRANHKASVSFPTSKTCWPPELIWNI